MIPEPKQKPTKVTKDDIELAEELSRITTIKSLLDTFSDFLTHQFAEIIETSYQGNSVATHFTICDKREEIEDAAQLLQAELLSVLGEIDEEDAHELAALDEELAAPLPTHSVDTLPVLLEAAIDANLAGAAEEEIEEGLIGFPEKEDE
jgi:hypothetical protein